MPFSTYSELKAAIGTWGRRTYTTSQADEFIDLAEAAIDRRLMHYRRETDVVVTLVDGVGTLPSDFKEVLSVNNADDASTINSFGITGNTIEVSPAVDQDVEMRYVAGIPPLSDSNTSNFVLAQAPDAYFWLCRAQAAAYHEEWDAAAGFERKANELLDELSRQSMIAQIGRARLTLRGPTP